MQTILVIENNAANRDTLLRILEFAGFRAVGAIDGSVGLQQAKALLPDLIICDVLMPGLNGYDVLKLLRQDLQTASIPFIFISAKAELTDIRYGLELGANAYVTKPYTLTELMEAVTHHLAENRVIA
jgi:diguanylate cyclase